MNNEQYLIAINTFIYQDDLIRINILGNIESRYSEYYTWEGLVINTIDWNPYSLSNNFAPYASGRIPTIDSIVSETRNTILKMKAKRRIKSFKSPIAQKCMRLILQDRGVM